MICLTFDTDWMSDEDFARFLGEFPIPGKATFFLHDNLTSALGTEHELCPHPFIDDLRCWREALSVQTAGLPRRPMGVRTHSCVFSHMIGVGLNELGFRYVSQATNLFQRGLTPHRHPWGIWEMPIYYMDNMDYCLRRNWPNSGHEPFSPEIIRKAVGQEGLYVFDFHPLHIGLNTRSYDDYSAVKDRILGDRKSPFELRFPGRGVRTFFAELCSAMRSAGEHSHSCWDALQLLGCA